MMVMDGKKGPLWFIVPVGLWYFVDPEDKNSRGVIVFWTGKALGYLRQQRHW